jgi:hypothetical protein
MQYDTDHTGNPILAVVKATRVSVLADLAHARRLRGSTGGSSAGRVHCVTGGTRAAIMRTAACTFGRAGRKRYGAPAAPRSLKPTGRLFRRLASCRDRSDQSKCSESKAVGKPALSRCIVGACLRHGRPQGQNRRQYRMARTLLLRRLGNSVTKFWFRESPIGDR